MIRSIVRLAAGLFGLILFYVAAGFAGSMIPVNSGWRQAGSGVRIYVVDNGIHTDLVLPAATEGMRWDDLLKPEDLADPKRAGASHLAFGWGDRDFYLNTPTWWDVNPIRVGRAFVGAGATVVHVSHIAEPQAGANAKAIVLRPEEYRRLAAFIRGTFGKGPPVRGYGGADAFYVAQGGYSLLRTCNAWTGEALRAAGLRVGAWTPFASGVMQWF
ncbi:TIGR02117 family protein [Sphingomonas psychrotolerans]|uniref:TIGR02117 family protein n=1 Tax=Sphingomonas psychrotolerans TaxID=1327635 RepID=A0ABU3N3D1_9SPHN|nr:TIGR02117 family protein [Sphingomonas psychrotolerans]MDT8759044.1 TIGR02117 family protein [Sphingomonas psychrotolerans]